MKRTQLTHTKRLIAVVTTAGLLVSGTAAVAYAADPPGSTAPATAERHGRRTGAVLQVAADTIGIERSALVDAVRDGQSIAEVATANDVAPQAVVDALVAAANTRVDTAVANGRIDAARAATIKERIPERTAKLVDGDLERRNRRHHARAKARRHARRAGFAVAAETIGIERKALRDAVRGGQSVADVAREHDVEPQAVVDALVAAAGKRIDQAVEKGRLDAERAEQLKARVDRTPRTPTGG